MDIQVEKFSSSYVVRTLTQEDVEIMYMLCKSNPMYYEFHPPFITKKGIMEDLDAVPLGRCKSDKYFLGYFYDHKLIAILDFIDGYPITTCGYIGLFMMDKSQQGKQIGSFIISEVKKYTQALGFQELQLGYMKGNQESECFWMKQGFQPIGEKEIKEGIVVKMQYIF